MNSEPALILLSGLPGSGKTTFASALSACLECEHIESDAIRRSIALVPTFTFAESGRVFARVELDARHALESGRHALVDATNLTTRDRGQFLKLADSFRVKLVAVRLNAPEAVIRARLSVPRTGHSQANFGIYERMRDRPQPFGRPSVVVDTRFDLGPALALVRALVGDVANG